MPHIIDVTAKTSHRSQDQPSSAHMSGDEHCQRHDDHYENDIAGQNPCRLISRRPNAAWICGNATLTIVLSETSSMAQRTTAITITGFTWPDARGGHFPSAGPVVSTTILLLPPTRRGASVGSSSIRTGNRRVTLTQFPLVFSEGSKENVFPDPRQIEATLPVRVAPGSISTCTVTDCPGRMRPKAVSLKFASTHQSEGSTIENCGALANTEDPGRRVRLAIHPSAAAWTLVQARLVSAISSCAREDKISSCFASNPLFSAIRLDWLVVNLAEVCANSDVV